MPRNPRPPPTMNAVTLLGILLNEPWHYRALDGAAEVLLLVQTTKGKDAFGVFPAITHNCYARRKCVAAALKLKEGERVSLDGSLHYDHPSGTARIHLTRVSGVADAK